MMESPERKALFLLASILGGFLIFVFCDITNNPYLKAPSVHRNTRDTPDSSNMADDVKDLEGLRKRAIQALFVSKNTLPFCKPTSNAKSKGKFLSYEVFMLIDNNTPKTFSDKYNNDDTLHIIKDNDNKTTIADKLYR